MRLPPAEMTGGAASDSTPLERVRQVARLPLAQALALDPDLLAADLAAVPDADLAAVPDADLAAVPDADLAAVPDADLAAVPDADLATPSVALLHLARVLEPPLRIRERVAALDRLARLRPEPTIMRQIAAERAIDLAKENRLDEAEELARTVLAAAAEDAVATARATEALGRSLAWRGTAPASARARIHLLDAASRYARLEADQWRGFCLFWCANAVDFQRGQLAAAERGMRDALPLLGPPRRAIVLTFLGDLLSYRGDVAGAEAALSEAATLTADRTTLAYVAWSRAKMASYSGDAQTTLRLVQETDRDLAELELANTRATFAADASEMLDRVGERAAAARYLDAARAIDPDDEFVRLAAASFEVRHGDPEAALLALRQVLLEPWLEGRLVWRLTLLTAWATLRAGRDGVGAMAARCLDQVAELGGLAVALNTEPTLLPALLPLAAAAGSAAAARLLAKEGWTARLLGASVVGHDGVEAEFPNGLPGELARLVLSTAGGLAAEEAIEALWPDESIESARRRLRQVLSRLGSRLPGLVIRDGDRLAGGAWADAVAFEAAANAALTARDPAKAQAALALWGGIPLPADPYATWALERRERLTRARVRLLDLLADDAGDRGLPGEEARLLELAISDDRYDEERYLRAAGIWLAGGQRPRARALVRRAAAMLTELGVPEPPRLRRLAADIEAH